MVRKTSRSLIVFRILIVRTKYMQFYFIGGLGSNSYHLAPLMDELGFPVTFLDPYREMIQTEKDLCAWVSWSDWPGGRDLFIGALLGWRFGSLSGC